MGVYRGDTEEERGGDGLERKSSGVHCVRDLRFGRLEGDEFGVDLRARRKGREMQFL